MKSGSQRLITPIRGRSAIVNGVAWESEALLLKAMNATQHKIAEVLARFPAEMQDAITTGLADFLEALLPPQAAPLDHNGPLYLNFQDGSINRNGPEGERIAPINLTQMPWKLAALLEENDYCHVLDIYGCGAGPDIKNPRGRFWTELRRFLNILATHGAHLEYSQGNRSPGYYHLTESHGRQASSSITSNIRKARQLAFDVDGSINWQTKSAAESAISQLKKALSIHPRSLACAHTIARHNQPILPLAPALISMSWCILVTAACAALRQLGLVKRYATHGSTLPGCADIVGHYLATEVEKIALLVGEVNGLAAYCRRHKLCDSSTLELGDILVKLAALAGQNLRSNSHASNSLPGLLAGAPIKAMLLTVASTAYMPHIPHDHAHNHDRLEVAAFALTELVEEGGVDCAFTEASPDGVIARISVRLRARIRRNLDVLRMQRPQHGTVQAGDRIENSPSPDQCKNFDDTHDENDETEGES